MASKAALEPFKVGMKEVYLYVRSPTNLNLSQNRLYNVLIQYSEVPTST